MDERNVQRVVEILEMQFDSPLRPRKPYGVADRDFRAMRLSLVGRRATRRAAAVIVEIDEKEAMPALEANLQEAEIFIANMRVLLDQRGRDQGTVARVGPSVVWAGKRLTVAFAPCDFRASVAAGIVKARTSSSSPVITMMGAPATSKVKKSPAFGN